MNRTTRLASIALFVMTGLAVLAGPTALRADGPADLAAGRAALASGELDKALTLLASAAQAMPQDVEAQLNLGHALLAAGQRDKALDQYRAVLRISPTNADAKRMVDALTGQAQSADQRLALARLMLDAMVYPQATGVLTDMLLNVPCTETQRVIGRQMLTESILWQQFTTQAVVEATKAINEAKGTPAEGQCRVLAAMALVTVTTPENLASARQMLKSAGELGGVWKQRAELVDWLSKLDMNISPESSAGFGALLAAPGAVPPGGYRDELILRTSLFLSTVAKTRADQGDWQTALKIVWPMICNQPMPAKLTADAQVNLTGGWVPLKAHQPAANRDQIIEALRAIARREFTSSGSSAQLAGMWIAAECLRQLPPDWSVATYSTDKRLQLVEDLADMSRPAPTRKKGELLSVADSLQQKIIMSLAGDLVNEDQRGRLCNAIFNQVNRYKAVNDRATGVSQFVTLADMATMIPKPVVAGPVVAMDGKVEEGKAVWVLELPAGPWRFNLRNFFAQELAALGAEEFAKAAAGGTVDANAKLNRYDMGAIQLTAGLLAEYPENASGVLPQADTIINRYVGADQWAAAVDATTKLFATVKTDVGKWALARLKGRQAAHDEDALLAAQHKLPDQLSPKITDVLTSAVAIVKADSRDANRDAAISLAGTLIARYAALDRQDLAEAVIALVAQDDRVPAAAGTGSPLADWALVARANLLDAQATAPLALAVKQFDGVKKLKLVDQHAAEIKLLGELLDKFPASRFVAGAIERVARIGRIYQDYKGYDASAGLLADFIKAHPKLAAVERLEFTRVQVLLTKAFAAFSERPDRDKADKPPTKLSDEYGVAIDEIAAFLKAHPAGPQSPLAENELVAVARTYGQAGAWPVAREVIKRFAAAVPDFRTPERLRLMEAATLLGQLDSAHGLSLLANPPPPAAMGWREDGAAGYSDYVIGMSYDSKLVKSGSGTLTSIGSADLWKDMEGDKKRDGYGRDKPATAEPSVSAKPSPAPLPTTPAGPSGRPSSGQPDAPALDDLSKVNDGLRRIQPADRLHDVPGETVAMIHQAQQQQASRVARLQEQRGGQGQGSGGGGAADNQLDLNGSIQGVSGGTLITSGASIVLPAGPILSEAEMKRQDEAADEAYKILIELVKVRATPTTGAALLAVSDQARGEIMWLIGFFEGQLRANQAVVVIDRFLKDQPADQARVALAFQAITDRVTWASQRQRADKIDQAWVDARHDLFEQARTTIDAFVKFYSAPERLAEKPWANRARLLAVDSYTREAALVSIVSAARAGGLLARSGEELIALMDSHPDFPEAAGFPNRIWDIANQLTNLGQRSQAIQVLGMLPVRFPTNALASQAVLRIAQLYATELQAPLQAVETYQEYMAMVGDNETVRAQVFSIAQQLAGKQRYLEAMHVYAIFVDSFPTDNRAPMALQAIGQVHQSNEAWSDAITAYQRVLVEYPNNAVAPAVKLAIAECDIHLSKWKDARKIYEEYAQQYGGGVPPVNPNAGLNPPVGQPMPQPAVQAAGVNIQQRIDTLKQLDRYQTLLADKEITRNRDDAQFQIGQICLERLGNKVKAIEEFSKVVKNWPNGDRAAPAQFEIGKALLALGRLGEARQALMKVATNYKESPLAAQALYRVGQSYEQQAQKLAAVTLTQARQIAFEQGQKGAYKEFQSQQDTNIKGQLAKRNVMKMAAASQPAMNDRLEMDEAYNAFRYNPNGDQVITNTARQAEQRAETESALEVANRQDRINEAYREAVDAYGKLAKYTLSTVTGDALMRMAVIYETELKDQAKAMATYAQIVKYFPGTPVAEEAAWKQVKFYEQQSMFKEAVDAYTDFIVTYPASSRLAEAQYAKAEALEQLGRWIEAMDAYQMFREKFPSSPKAQAAEQQIQWIKAYRKN